MGKRTENNPGEPGPGSKSKLSPAAIRALAEAEERRKARKSDNLQGKTEIGGCDGPDPVRYGDWEKDGTISDF